MDYRPHLLLQLDHSIYSTMADPCGLSEIWSIISSLAVKQPLIIHNVDGTVNKGGTITSYCNLWVQRGTKVEKLGFYVTNLGRDCLILGYPWFQKFNPNFNWETNTLMGDAIEVNMAGYRNKVTTKLRALELNKDAMEEERKAIQEQLPATYCQYWEVFSEQASY